MLTRFNASCQRGNKSACNRFDKFSKRYPEATSEAARKAARSPEARAEATAMLTKLNDRCQGGDKKACQKFSKKFPEAASKARATACQTAIDRINLICV